MKIIVLGSAAGGGFPQWNCNCGPCRRARAGDPAAAPRSQSSIAVSRDGRGPWLLCNASPDLRNQINANKALHPEGVRGSPIAAAMLTNADIDHVAGLLSLRESQPLVIYATPRVQSVLAANSVFRVLNRDLVERKEIALDTPFRPLGPGARDLGLVIEAFSVPGKVALYLEDPTVGNYGSMPEDTVALKVSQPESGASFFYVPGCAALPSWLAERLMGAPLVLFDGTTWTDDEMLTSGTGDKTAARMGHMSMSGEGGSIAAFADLGVERKYFIHINNTNPALLDDSPERRQAEAAGWVITHDGMEIVL